MCDELHRTCSLSDRLWTELRREYSEEAVLELLMVAGFYRTISYLTNALRLPLEAFGTRFPPGGMHSRQEPSTVVTFMLP